MPKQATSTANSNIKLKQQRKKMVNSGQSERGIINNINHKTLALESTTYKKYNK